MILSDMFTHFGIEVKSPPSEDADVAHTLPIVDANCKLFSDGCILRVLSRDA
jgi:hypothetical protein